MSELARLSGIGPKRVQALQASGIASLRDLVFHLPRRYLDRTHSTPIASLREGMEAFFSAEVLDSVVLGNRLVVHVEDGTGRLELLFFRGLQFLKPHFHPGSRLSIAGTVTSFRDLQIVHPEWEALREGQEPRGGVLPVYPLTEAMEEARVEHRRLQHAALEALEKFSFSDPIGSSDRLRLELRSETAVLRVLHAPQSMDEVAPAFREIKIRELWPLAVKMNASLRARVGKGKTFSADPESERALRAHLPFTLTAAQEDAIRQIGEALEKPTQFHGLLQGDVGSGKTAVALLAAMRVMAAGSQVALLAPTEILSEQHFRTVTLWMKNSGREVALLTAATPSEERIRILAGLAAGKLSLVIGTHSLFSEDVAFRDLRFVIIDEQHRFGVQQRASLLDKGREPHVLFVSATPIPRSLAQAWFGDMECVTLGEKPPGRLPIKTRLVPAEKEADMVGFLFQETQKDNQVYWVVPRIDTDLEATLKRLRAYKLDWKVEAVHGRKSAEERDRILTAFRKGELQVLVATTVIEVGVDVPGANLMVVEGADRFGLAQLHQLRGRTGRGREQAWCFLLQPAGGWPEETEIRLREFAATEDGFKIAEMDLKRRGSGNLEGTEQSGFGALRFSDAMADASLILELRRRAAEIAI